MTGETPRVTLAERPVTVFGDQRLLTVAVGGLLQALARCVERSAGLGKIELRMMAPREAPVRGVEVVRTALRLPETVLARIFDVDWPEHPAGTAGAVLVAAARRIALLQGGALDAKPVDAGGCRLVLSLPAAE